MYLNMNEAYLEMLKENKVTHKKFNKNEFLQVDEYGNVINEKGYTLEEWWKEAKDSTTFRTGWTIYN